MNLFIICSLVLIDLILIFAFCYTAIKRGKFHLQLLAFLFQDVVIQTAYTFTFLFQDERIVRLLFDLIFIAVIFFLFFFMYYLSEITKYILVTSANHSKLPSTLLKLQNKVPIALAIIDLVFISLDVQFQFLYELVNIAPAGSSLAFWNLNYSNYFTVHICIYSAFLSTMAFISARKIFRTNYLFRKSYINLLLTLGIIVLLNFLFLYEELVVDFSFVCYAYIGVIFWHYNNFELKREQKEYFISLVADDVSNAIACFDYEGNCIYRNEVANQFFGADKKTPKRLEEYIHSSWFSDYIEEKSNIIYGDDSFEINGQLHYFHVEYRKILDSNGTAFGSFLKLEDTTEEYTKFKTAKYRAKYDELTGLYNRRTFFEKVEELLHAEPDVPRYMVATNILNFRLLNDLFGTRLGDTVLKKQAEQLSIAKYSDVILGRISSDKYGMFIRVSDFKPNLAAQNTKKIQAITNSLNYRIKVYIGVYEVLNANESAASMCDKALLAINKIHGDYEQTISFYDSTMMEGILKDKNILSEFPKALRNGEFELYLQPIVNKYGECKTAEALVRWQHPLIGNLSPNYFLSTLENTSYIYTLDSYIWEKAIQRLKEWHTAGHNDFSISLIISSLDFNYSDLYIALTDLVERYEIPPQKIKLQIQEDVLFNNADSNSEVIASLRNYGFICEIDNYGNGSSTLNLHKEVDFNGIRIDMEFMNTMRNFDRAKIIASQVVKIAKSLNMTVTVLGVNTQEDFALVKKAGCDLFQGYYFDRPLSIEAFEEKYMGGKADE